MFTVYRLVDPRDYCTRYIGITEDVYSRMRQHSRCEGNNASKNAWIQELQQEQLMFIMDSIEKVETFEEALEREIYWILSYLSQGVNLTNISGVPVRKELSTPGDNLCGSVPSMKKKQKRRILTPEEASYLFFKISTGQIVSVPEAQRDEFNIFIRHYVEIEDQDVWWDKAQRRQILSYVLEQGVHPAFCSTEGEPLYVKWESI